MNEAFDWTLLGAPLLAGLLVTATHVALGREVLRRGIIFIDLTIAQIAALGVIAIEAFGIEAGGFGQQLAAGGAALLAAALLSYTERRFHDLQEALIGSLYIVAASAAILLLAHNPHGAEHLAELLAGQILWVSYSDLVPVAALYAPILLLWWRAPHLRAPLFYLLFALAVTASVQLLGVYLVFATLILPALAVQGLAGKRALWWGYALAATAYGLGLALSVPWDLPSGPLVVCTLAVLALFAAALRRLAPPRLAPPPAPLP